MIEFLSGEVFTQSTDVLERMFSCEDAAIEGCRLYTCVTDIDYEIQQEVL